MTQAEVVVMYDDLSIVRVPWADRVTLRRDKVLIIAISQPCPNPGVNFTLNGRRRQTSKYGEDFYMLYEKDDWYILHAFSHDTYRWFSLSSPWGDSGWKEENTLPPWLPTDGIYFTGSYVDDAIWALALKKFDREMF